MTVRRGLSLVPPLALLGAAARHDETMAEGVPRSISEWLDLPSRSVEALRALGFHEHHEVIQRGKRKEKNTVMLFPEKKWFEHIPEALLVYSIVEGEIVFERPRMPRDTRFGCLSFGVKLAPPKVRA